MKIDINKIKDGMMNGEIVYICDHRYNGFDKKPIRNVPPTKVIIRPKEEANKHIYYSQSFFSGFTKSGKIRSVSIPLYDNTGWRTYPGVPLNVFDEEEECIQCYNSQVDNAIEGYKSWFKDIQDEYSNKLIELNKLKV